MKNKLKKLYKKDKTLALKVAKVAEVLNYKIIIVEMSTSKRIRSSID